MKEKRYVSLALSCFLLIIGGLTACQTDMPKPIHKNDTEQPKPNKPTPEAPEQPQEDQKKDDPKKADKISFRLNGSATFDRLDFTNHSGEKYQIRSSWAEVKAVKAVCILRAEDDSYIHRSLVQLECNDAALSLKPVDIQLEQTEALASKSWQVKFFIGGTWDDSYEHWTISATSRVCTQKDVERGSVLDFPMSTPWLSVSPREEEQDDIDANALQLLFSPEGNIWIQELRTDKSSDNLLLNTILWRGNTLRYGYTLSYTDKNLLNPIISDQKADDASSKTNYKVVIEDNKPFAPSVDSRYICSYGILPRQTDAVGSVSLSAEGVFEDNTEEAFRQDNLIEVTLSTLPKDKVLYHLAWLKANKLKPAPPVDPPTPPAPPIPPAPPVVEEPKDRELPRSEYDASARANQVWWVHGVNAQAPEVKDWGFASVDGGLDQIGLTWQASYGWYDVNKLNPTPGRGSKDSDLCWAAVASNTIHWWLEQNKDYISRYAKYTGPKIYPNSFESEIFGHYQKYFANAGGDLKATYDWFFNGLYGGSPKAGGGYFKEVFGDLKPAIQEGIRTSDFSDLLAKGIKEHSALAIMIEYPNRYLHVISIWGAEFDAQGNVTHLYVTDSNDRDLEDQRAYSDYRNRQIIKAGLLRIPINLSTKDGVAMEGSIKGKYGFKLERLFTFPLYRDKWEEYFSK